MIFIGFLTGCNKENQIKPPENLIEKDKFISILIDIHIANSQSMQLNIQGIPSKYNHELLQKYIFNKHEIVRADYDSTVSYYMKFPDRYATIYESVLNQLSKIAGDLKADSLDNNEEVLRVP